MSQFEFEDVDSDLDERSVFANLVCKLLVQKHDGVLEAALKEVKEIYNHFEEHVRNIYEKIDSEIPLFALYDLERYGADNWDLTTDEYTDAIFRTKIACFEYYIQ